MTALPYTIEAYQDAAAWKRARVTGIGASESAAVVRLSRFCSTFGMWMRKLEKRVEDDDDEQGGSMTEWGHRHEPAINTWFLDQNGEHGMHASANPGDFTIFRSKERPHVFATVDRMVNGGMLDARSRPLEIKCAWYDAAREWKERVPIAYRVQVQHQLYVTGCHEGFIAVLLNGCFAKWYREERNDRFIAKLMGRLDEFWDRVQTKRAPDPDGHKSDLQAILKLYPQSRPESVELPDELSDAGREWDALSEQEKAIEAKKNQLKARVQNAMGPRYLARCHDDSGFSWKSGAKGRTFRRVANVRHDDE